MKNKFFLVLIFFSQIDFLSAQNYKWEVLQTGAGGWTTGLDIHSSGDPIYTRVDVGSAYRYNSQNNTWINIVTSNNLPESEIHWQKYRGVLSIKAAPSNQNLVYMAYNDGIFKSYDQGDNWIKTNLPVIEMNPNDDASKLSGERISIDPQNEDIVYFGSIEDGLWFTNNSGDNWSPVSEIPSGEEGRGVRQIHFVKNSGTTSGATNVIYILVDGEGVFKSEDAGQTWTNISAGVFGSISDPIFLDSNMDESGQLFVVGHSLSSYESLGLMKYDGLIWTQALTSSTVFLSVAVDPFNLDRVLLFSEGYSEIARTQNVNSPSPSWDYPGVLKTSENIPWLSWTYGDWFSLGEVEFDPAIPGRIWVADGLGTWTIDNLNDNTLEWQERALGQEHLVSNDLIVNGSGHQVTAHWDRPVFYHNDISNFPEEHLPSSRFNSSWDLDISPSDPNFMVAIIEDHRYCCYDEEHRTSGYSINGGISWTPFEAQPNPTNNQGIYGNIAISANDNSNVVWLPTGNEMPYYTTDLGISWNQANLPNAGSDCCLNFNFVYKKALTADRVLPNTFYIYNWENGSVYISSDGGQSWTEKTDLQDFYGWHSKLITSPNNAEHLWFSHGAEESIPLISSLKRSTDGGQSWQTLNNTSEVLNVAIGVPLPNSNYPTIFIQGRVDDEFGFWMSADEGLNWLKIGEFPLGIYDVAKVMEADPKIPSRVYVGFGGNGFVYGQDSDIANSVNELKLKVILEGAFLESASTMSTNLSENNLLNLNQPFNQSPWNYTGNESLNYIPENAVDWFLVEARSSSNPLLILDQTAAILKNNGTVFSAINNQVFEGIQFKNLDAEESYFIVVRHRSHIDVMSKLPLALNTNTIFDFTQPENIAFGTNQLAQLEPNLFALKAGDITANGVITVSDFNKFQQDSSSINGYYSSDLNMDGNVTILDFNLYQSNSSAIGIEVLRY